MIIHEAHSEDKLASWDIANLHFDEVWYTYDADTYEGSGQMVYRLKQGGEDLYGHHDMGHCSCFGPTEHIKGDVMPLPQLVDHLKKNTYYWPTIKQLFESYKIGDGKYDELFKD